MRTRIVIIACLSGIIMGAALWSDVSMAVGHAGIPGVTDMTSTQAGSVTTSIKTPTASGSSSPANAKPTASGGSGKTLDNGPHAQPKDPIQNTEAIQPREPIAPRQ